ncbi:MAG: GNAT family N-acetyltransferase [Chlamydiales bacterium]|nr:GNAT family N-acetyltransferase [Chlamydiales bacterium]
MSSAIHVTPCEHEIEFEQLPNFLENNELEIRVDEEATSVFEQINKSVMERNILCPVCSMKISKIDSESATFPLSKQTFPFFVLAPIKVSMHERNNKDAVKITTLTLHEVKMANIVNEGTTSDDDGETYRRLSEVANDTITLISIFGPVAGRLLSLFPTSWKARVYRMDIEVSERKKLNHFNWVMVNEEGHTVGTFSLSEIDKKRFSLEESFQSLKLYNVGVCLHSNFHRRGIVSGVAREIFKRISSLKIDIDGFWISTSPENVGVIRLAEKLEFEFIKAWDDDKKLFPFIKTSLPRNLYWRTV